MNKITVTVRYLGTFSQLTGKREETLGLEEGATVGELARLLGLKYGRELRRRLEDGESRPVLFIVDGSPAPSERRLGNGELVLVTYPAGGG
ncbi:MAG: MoaD/ThiS family protein [Thermoplasmata archaeon]